MAKNTKYHPSYAFEFLYFSNLLQIIYPYFWTHKLIPFTMLLACCSCCFQNNFHHQRSLKTLVCLHFSLGQPLFCVFLFDLVHILTLTLSGTAQAGSSEAKLRKFPRSTNWTMSLPTFSGHPKPFSHPISTKEFKMKFNRDSHATHKVCL